MMQFLEDIKLHIAQLDQKTFIAYMVGFLLGNLLIVSGIFYYYYSTVADFNNDFTDLNSKRSEMRMLFEREARVKKQEAEVKEMLSKDNKFIIAEEFKNICAKVNMQPVGEPVQSESLKLSGKYREYTLSMRFDNVDMKQVCELLQAIEEVKRIYTKSIDIVRAQGMPAKLNATLVIGTLLTETPGAS